MERKHSNKHIDKIICLATIMIHTFLAMNIMPFVKGYIGCGHLHHMPEIPLSVLWNFLLGLCVSTIISMAFPLISRVIYGGKIPHDQGRLLCILNSIVALVFYAILEALFGIFFGADLCALMFYFINRWLFVADKEKTR